jgi:hypothetical protein
MAVSRIEPSVSRTGNDAVYGHGADGNVIITTNTSITSDMHYNNLTVNTGVLLNSNGFRIFVKDTLTLNGFIGIGSVSGGTVGQAASTVSDGTVKGHGTGAITYRAGGRGGNDSSSTALPSFLFKDINAMSGGLFMDTTSGMTPINGGSFGGAGQNGVTLTPLTNSDTWPGKAGATGATGSVGSVNSAANPYATTAGVPGGRGTTASDGNVTGYTEGTPGTGGAGGLGGGVVCVLAKTVIGSGMIISVGSTGAAGTAGTTGTAGSQGANGAKAPDLAYHVAPVASHVAPTHNPSHHHGSAVFSDFHAHTVNPHPHCCASHTAAAHYGGDKFTPASHSPASHFGGHNHNSGHYHHTGGRHHPHSNDHHGGITFTHNWPSVIHSHYKVNHASQHSHPATTGTFHGRIEHVHAGGHDGHTHHGAGRIGHTHSHANGNDLGNGVNQGGGMQVSGGHHHGPHTYSDGLLNANRWSHHANPDTHTAQPNGHWTGGAGGVNDGVNTGRAAPARTAPSGKGGGPGGGGAILIVTDSIADTITYNTSGGTLLEVGDTPAASGSAYILINS